MNFYNYTQTLADLDTFLKRNSDINQNRVNHLFPKFIIEHCVITNFPIELDKNQVPVLQLCVELNITIDAPYDKKKLIKYLSDSIDSLKITIDKINLNVRKSTKDRYPFYIIYDKHSVEGIRFELKDGFKRANLLTSPNYMQLKEVYYNPLNDELVREEKYYSKFVPIPHMPILEINKNCLVRNVKENCFIRSTNGAFQQYYSEYPLKHPETHKTHRFSGAEFYFMTFGVPECDYTNEVWVDSFYLPEKYEVSDKGRVRNKLTKEFLPYQFNSFAKQLRVMIDSKAFLVAKLMWTSFHPGKTLNRCGFKDWNPLHIYLDNIEELDISNSVSYDISYIPSDTELYDDFFKPYDKPAKKFGHTIKCTELKKIFVHNFLADMPECDDSYFSYHVSERKYLCPCFKGTLHTKRAEQDWIGQLFDYKWTCKECSKKYAITDLDNSKFGMFTLVEVKDENEQKEKEKYNFTNDGIRDVWEIEEDY